MTSNTSLRYLLPLLAAFGLTCAYCTTAVTDTTDQLPECAITAPLDSLFATLFSEPDAPGGVIEVMRNDTIIYRGCFGVADLSTGEPLTDSTVFNISSSSKLPATAAIMKLVELRKISLDDSLSKFFPEFQGKFFNSITVREILTHTTGLPDLRPRSEERWSDFLIDNKTPFANLRDFQLFGMEDDHMKVFSQLKTVEWEPGTHFQMFDPSLILLAPIVERVTGERYDNWMARNIFEPSGMQEAYYYSVDGRNPTTSHAYRPNTQPNELGVEAYVSPDGEWQEYDYGEVPYFLTKSNRGLFTSARSYMAFLSAFYGGKILSQESIDEIGRPLVPIGVENAYFGYGTAVSLEPGFPQKNYHLNSNGAFSIVDATWPSENMSYVIFTNRNDWDMRPTCHKVDSIIKSHYFD